MAGFPITDLNLFKIAFFIDIIPESSIRLVLSCQAIMRFLLFFFLLSIHGVLRALKFQNSEFSITPSWDWNMTVQRGPDYRCNDGRFRLSAHDCRVPVPASQCLVVEQWIRTNQELLVSPSLCSKGKLREVGGGDWETMPNSLHFWVCGWTSVLRG
jgi:hypothetical protein